MPLGFQAAPNSQTLAMLKEPAAVKEIILIFLKKYSPKEGKLEV